MNRLITRLQKRSRVAVGSTMAVIVSLPLGASIGLASASSAAVPSPAIERASTTSDNQAETPRKNGKSKESTKEKSTLGDVVAWNTGYFLDWQTDRHVRLLMLPKAKLSTS